MVAIDLSKQQGLDADVKAIQQINFTGNIDREATMLFSAEEAKETILDFSQGTMRVLSIYFLLIWYQHKITQYDTLNLKLSNLQLSELTSVVKNGTEVEATLNILSKVIGNSKDETNLLHIWSFIARQVSRLGKTFTNNSSFNIKLSKIQLSEMVQLGGILPFQLFPLYGWANLFGKQFAKNKVLPKSGKKSKNFF